MDGLRLPKHKEKIGYRGNTYMVETEYDSLMNRITIRLFKNMRLVSSRSVKIRMNFSEGDSSSVKVEKLKEKLAYYHREEYALLLSLFELSQKIKYSGDGPAHHSLGLVFLARDLLIEAKNEFLTALDKSPEYSLAYNHLGIVHLKSGMIKEGIKSFKTALKIDPGFADFHHNLGNAYLEDKNYEEAEKEFREALRINPRYSDAYINLGYRQLERLKEDADLSTEPALVETLDNFKKAYQFCFKKASRIEELFEKAYTWEDLSRIYILLRNLLNEESSLEIESLCEYFKLRFKYEPKAIEKKELEEYLIQLIQEIVEGKNYPDLRFDLALTYIFYSRYFLKLAENKFQEGVCLAKGKSSGEVNLKITKELEKNIDGFLEEVEVKN